MTDDSAASSRFAFLPKNFWDVLLNLAPIPLAGIALWFSVLFVVYIVESLVWLPGTFEPLAFAIENEILIPTITAMGTTLYFLVGALSQRRDSSGNLDPRGFGQSPLLLVSAIVIVAMLAIFWSLYAIYNRLDTGIEHHMMASAGFGGAWAVGAVTALGLRRLDRRFVVICLLPPIACLVTMLLNPMIGGWLAWQVKRIAQSVQPGRRSMITIPVLLAMMMIVLTACILPVTIWAERRLFSSHRRAVGIACAYLWALAAIIPTLPGWFFDVFY